MIKIVFALAIILLLDIAIAYAYRKITDKPYEYANHPAHYNKPGQKECIEVMREIWGDDVIAQWCEITAFKYEYRMGSKPGEDIDREKAKIRWYKDKAKELRK